MSLPREIWMSILEMKQASFEHKVMEAIQYMFMKEQDLSAWNMKDIQNHVMHDVCQYGSANPTYKLYICKEETKRGLKNDCETCYEAALMTKYLFKAKVTFRQQEMKRRLHQRKEGLIQMLL